MRSRLLLAALVGIWACGESPSAPPDEPPPNDGPPAPLVGAVQVSSPIGALLAAGQEVSLEATVVSTTGATMQASVTWEVADETVASVSSVGRVTARAAGETVVTATAAGVTGSIDLTVAASNLDAIGTLLRDPLPDHLFASLGGETEAALRSAWSQCAESAASGNLTQLQSCVADARTGLSSASAPEKRPTAGLLSLFVDWIERHLNLG